MKIAGAQWDEIAEVVGYPSARHAIYAVERALEKELHDDEASRDKLRQLASKRLERLLRGCWAKAIDPENPEMVLWAMCYRMKPHKDVHIIGGMEKGHAPPFQYGETGPDVLDDHSAADDSAMLCNAILKEPFPPISTGRFRCLRNWPLHWPCFISGVRTVRSRCSTASRGPLFWPTRRCTTC